MTLLYLVRHGETVDNAHHIMQGQTPGQLNETGIRQAEEVAERLKAEPIDVFVASDLRVDCPAAWEACRDNTSAARA